MGFTMETGVVDAETVADAVVKLVVAGKVKRLSTKVKVVNGKVKVWMGPVDLNHVAVAVALSAHLPECVNTGRTAEVLSITGDGAKIKLVPPEGEEQKPAEEPGEEDAAEEGAVEEGDDAERMRPSA